jgi:hypothetical protein
MTITDYATLVQAVVDAAEDDGTEFATYIPIAIDLAENRLYRDLDLTGVVSYVSIGTSATQYVPKPTGFKTPKSLSYLETYTSASASHTRYKPLVFVGETFLMDFWGDRSITGTPKYYSSHGETQLIVAPKPVGAATFELAYNGKPTELSSSNTTNYFTRYCPDALFFATMGEMMVFAKNTQEIQIWEGKYSAAIEMLRNEGRRERGDDNRNATGAANTVVPESK